MRVALGQQIEEVGTTLDERRADYDHKIALRKMGPSLAEYRTRRLEAVKRTLLWLRRHEDVLRQRCPEMFGERV
ncbi:Uncharacterised protein [Starkeya nomas]|uniref:Uncharacterized protein n=1 Tax=Starkeya nomas TaxID=2666134 RepID=A0A5S9R5V6_9HYPH|nr:hypothetical protein [Starkeya nomas]CAA0128953.1 Uncharacterised protein [Starkeya nomas]